MRRIPASALALVPVSIMLKVAVAHATAATLTWADARAAALRRAPELAVAARRTAVADAETRVAGALANPTVTLTTARETARLSAGVSQPLPLFGQRGLAVAAARADAAAVVRDSDLTRNELRWNATVAWVDTWEAGERARLLAGGAADARRLLAVAEERFGAGSSPRLDVVRATADEARARAEADAAAPLVAAAAARLAVWVGADPGSVAPSVAGAPGVAAALPPLPALLDALGAHPAVERDRAQQEAAAGRVDLERRLRLPIVSAELVINVGDPTLREPSGNIPTDVIAGAAFELPVLNLRGGAIARAEAQRGVAEAVAELDLAHLHAEVVDAYRRTEAAATRARAIARQALPAMEEARAMTEESYRSGRADLVRVLEAQRAVLDLRLAQAEAVAAWGRAFADLERAVGSPLE
jgi:cobalt-zinc-cadmium efflux system outer membrane protein